MSHLLNLAVLRGESVSAPPSGDPVTEPSAPRLPITRRRLLGIGSVAAFGLTPLVRAIGASIRPAFDVVVARNRVDFLVDGDARWSIDTARFAGSPHLDVERTDARIDIALRNARFPGADLPADFTCTLTRGVRGWQIALRMQNGRFSASAPFEPWLLGAAPLRSAVDLAAQVVGTHDGTVSLAGIGEAELYANWRMRFAGDGIARFDGLGGSLRSDALALSLLATEAASILATPPARRTLVEIERGERTWSASIPERASAGWRFSSEPNAFDAIAVETGEDHAGSRLCALIAEGTTAAIATRAHLCANIVADSGASGLPLRHLRYASASGTNSGSSASSAIVARFAEDPVWLHAAAGSVQLGDAKDTRPFEIVTVDGALTSYRIEPAQIATYIPVQGSLSEPVRSPAGLGVRFLLNGDVGEKRDATEVRIDNMRPDDPPFLTLASDPLVVVLRHEDLVHIQFQLVNMRVESRGTRRLAIGGTGSPVLVAHFPPQNIAEQAFFESESPATSEDPLNPVRLPVKTRISGTSRLAFKLPEGTSTIPMTADALLTAMREWEPSLAPTALPPQYVGDVGLIIDIDTIKANPIWAGYGKRPAIESYSKEKLSPLVKSAGATDFAGRPKDMSRSIAESKGFIQLRSGGSGAVRRGAADVVTSPGAIETARSSASKLGSAREQIESKYQIDLADLEAVSAAQASRIKAIVAIRPELVRPTNAQTAIESPYRLIISPNLYARWAHALKPVSHDHPVSGVSHTELWHTRLGLASPDDAPDPKAVDEESTELRTIRAIWMESPAGFNTNYANVPQNYEASGPSVANPFRMSLDEAHRHNIVHLSSNFRITLPATNGRTRRETYEPLPVKVDRLMLTSLGSWMNVRGAWPVSLGMTPLSVEDWRHRGTMGRDHYVRVVEKGYLFPFGNRASLVTITERKFHKAPWGSNIAYLRQRMYIIIREPEKTFRTSGLVRTGTQVLKSGPNGESIDLKMPFHKVRITTTVTPKLDPPGGHDINGKGTVCFWPFVATKPFLFQLSADDLDNRRVEFSMPLVFVKNDIADNATELKSARDKYDQSDTSNKWPTVPMMGQKVAFAESEKLGDTSYETSTITWSAEVPESGVNLPPDQPRFYPVMKKSALSIPSIKYLAGNDQGSEFKYNSKFLQLGFGAANQGKLMLDVFNAAAPVAMSFDTKGDKSGGFVKPNMNIVGLSRALGPIGGALDDVEGSLDKVVNNKFDPEDFFKGLGAKLFGVIDLWDILEALGLDKAPQFVTEALTPLQAIQSDLNALKGFVENPAVGSLGNNVKSDITNILSALGNILTDPSQIETALNTFRDHVVQLRDALPTVSFDDLQVKKSLQKLLNDFATELDQVSSFVSKLAQALEIPKELKITLEWAPELKSWPDTDPIFVAPKGVAKFRLGAEMVAQTNFKSAPKFEIYCFLEKFKIDLIAPAASFIVLHFNRLGFFANSSMKSDIVCDLEKLEFVGVLSFIETLKELIPLDGFSDPPAIDVSPSGISASFSLSLPNVAFGVFSLQNISLGAGFKVPFIGEPLSFSFNFCTRDNPFLLTISCIGGGGFFGITINPKGVHILEASFEVGAQLALDFGVASGCVYVFAGVYFKMEGDDCSLTGYFRIGGEVDVLGIISVSIELYLSLTYEFATGKLVGRATLTISVEVLFFEISVEISCEKKFAGSNGDPTFAQMMAPYDAPSLANPGQTVKVEPWKEYVSAFAW
jgi:hypothetical protein